MEQPEKMEALSIKTGTSQKKNNLSVENRHIEHSDWKISFEELDTE